MSFPNSNAEGFVVFVRPMLGWFVVLVLLTNLPGPLLATPALLPRCSATLWKTCGLIIEMCLVTSVMMFRREPGLSSDV